MKETLSVISGLMFFAASVPYIRAILKGRTKPSKASWLIWAGLDSIVLVGMIAQHTLNGQIIGAVLVSWMTALLALKYGQTGWTTLDKLCLGGAVLGLALWQTFSNPLLGLAASLAMIFIGAIPTFVSAWRDPNGEDRSTWMLFWLSCVAALFAIPDWTLADAAQPIIFTMIDTTMVYLLFVRPCLRPANQR
ncbi:MAG: hypothetical protein WCT10_03925 [Patescibacteria group bacterium]|jgi:hypothetical protein